MYWTSTVTVPASATAAHPFQVAFRGASYSMWWPPALPPGSISTGVEGVGIQITEPSGVVDETGTGCGSCGSGPQYWYSSDGSVGIGFTDDALGTVALLVST
jgi:hypothetical protein